MTHPVYSRVAINEGIVKHWFLCSTIGERRYRLLCCVHGFVYVYIRNVREVSSESLARVKQHQRHMFRVSLPWPVLFVHPFIQTSAVRCSIRYFENKKIDISPRSIGADTERVVSISITLDHIPCACPRGTVLVYSVKIINGE